MTGQPKQTYTYDSLGRITGYVNTANSATPQNKITRSFSYLTNGSQQTNRIGSVSYTKTTSTGTSTLVSGYSYTYDDNGNITKVFEGGVEKVRYTYDALNRLTREDNAYLNKTVVYTYDKSGDILNKKEYAYTTSTLGTATKTITYQYGDADCPNGLTSYNGETVTYDTNGNPLTYRGYTMTWEKGRQLASMTKGGTTTTFKYDASGLRTEKTQGETTTEYTYVGEKLVSMKSGETVMNFAYGADGSPYNIVSHFKNKFIRKEHNMSNRFTDTAAAEYILEEIKNGKYSNPLTAMGLLKQIINDLRGTSVAKEAEEVLKKYRDS